jgi:hypothetical protein
MSAVHTSISSLQSQAAAAVAAGDAAKALALYRAASRIEPKNLMHPLRAGDCLVRLGRIHEAVLAYRNVAERYAADGQQARAVSVFRLVQRLAPRDPIAARRLEELRQPPAPAPAQKTAAVAAASAGMFPDIELDVTPVSISCDGLGPLWDVPSAPAPGVADLEARVEELIAEVRRAQSEIQALKADSAEAVVISVY